MKYKVVQGDSLDVLKRLPDESISAVVTDPPYGLSNTDPKHVVEVLAKWSSGERDFVPEGKGFMGKSWDSFVPPPALWDEIFRILKPGGHALVFAGTRTVDLMTLSLRLAGFDIRESIAWLYGSGFPKSMDVSKAIDKAAGAERQVVGTEKVRDIRNGGGREYGEGINAGARSGPVYMERELTAPTTEDARRWEGWGTALKPAHEPIVVARKPFKGTVANNVLAHGTGALNIDACRVNPGEPVPGGGNGKANHGGNFAGSAQYQGERPPVEPHTRGRWPANVILAHNPDCEEVGTKKVRSQSPSVPQPTFGVKGTEEGTYKAGEGRNGEMSTGYASVEAWQCTPDCPVAELDAQSGERKAEGKVKGTEPSQTGQNDIYGTWGRVENAPYSDTGGASRFFYVAKAPRRERPVLLEHEDGKKVVHPTVKPLTLMRYLVRLVTPPEGIVLDPFAGSGTTIEAACLEGFSALGIEREADYVELINLRMDKHKEEGVA